MPDGEVQLSNGDVEQGNVWVQVSGWVRIEDVDGTVHYPPHRVQRIVGEAKYQSPHGRI